MYKLDQLKSFEDACQVLGLDPENVLPDFSNYPEQDRKSMEAHAKLVIVVRAANKLANGGEEWKPNFDNKGQIKWEIWWRKSSSGFRFHVYDLWGSHSNVGSRLCFESSNTAEYVANTFEALYNDYLM